MASPHFRRFFFLGLVSLASLWQPSAAPACEFCGMQGQTLTTQVDQASLVLYGTFSDAKTKKDGDGNDLADGTTVFNIETIVKKHKILADDKKVTLARYISADTEKKYKFLIFCDVYKGNVDPYHFIAFKPDSDVAKY